MAARRSKPLAGTPRSHGFSFPAEWEKQSAIWFSWPRPEGLSFASKYHTVPGNLAAIDAGILNREHVHEIVPKQKR